MKKTLVLTVVFVMLFSINAFARPPFYDSEEITVQGQRPKVEIEISELTVNIDAEDFVDGVAEKEIEITNEGNVPCSLTLTVGSVPVDLTVEATVDTDRLHKGESSTLRIRVELSEQQDVEDFSFTILVEAELN